MLEPAAGELAGVAPAQVALSLAGLIEAGWLNGAREFPLGIRAWRRAHLPVSPELLRRGADAAEAAFHRHRYAGTGDREALARVEHGSAWQEAPEVAQWARLAREESVFDVACDRCRVWAALVESRATRWRGFFEQSDRWLLRAEALADTPRAHFFLAFLRTVRSEQGPSTVASLDALAEGVTDEGEWFFVHQARAVHARSIGGDPTPHLRRSLQLALRSGLPFREATTRVLIAHALSPDGPAMRRELELVPIDLETLHGRDRCDFRWVWARAWLCDRTSRRRRSTRARSLPTQRRGSSGPGAPGRSSPSPRRTRGTQKRQPKRGSRRDASWTTVRATPCFAGSSGSGREGPGSRCLPCTGRRPRRRPGCTGTGPASALVTPTP